MINTLINLIFFSQIHFAFSNWYLNGSKATIFFAIWNLKQLYPLSSYFIHSVNCCGFLMGIPVRCSFEKPSKQAAHYLMYIAPPCCYLHIHLKYYRFYFGFNRGLPEIIVPLIFNEDQCPFNCFSTSYFFPIHIARHLFIRTKFFQTQCLLFLCDLSSLVAYIHFFGQPFYSFIILIISFAFFKFF